MSIGQGLPFGGAPFTTNGKDVLVNLESNPGLSLSGTELGGSVSDVREIAGSTWITSNAFFNGALGGYQQNNATTGSTAIVISPQGSVRVATAAAGATAPLAWTFTALFPTVPAGVINILAYGAVGNGVADDSAAFISAMALVNALPNQSLYIPPGYSFTYNQTVNGPLQLTNGFTTIAGVRRASKILFTGTTGDCIRVGAGSAANTAIEDIDLYASSLTDTLTSPSYVLNYTAGNGHSIRGVYISTSGHGLGNNCPAAGTTYEFDVRDLFVTVTGTTSIGIDLQTGTSVCRFDDILVNGPTQNSTTSIGIRFPLTKTQDTMLFTHFYVTGFDVALSMTPSVGMGDWIFTSGFVALNGQAALNLGGTGTLNRVTFENVWFDAQGLITASYAGCVNIMGSFYDISFTNCRFNSNVVLPTTTCFYIQTSASGEPLRLNGCFFDLCSNVGLLVDADVVLEVNGGMAQECGNAALSLYSSAGWVNRKIFSDFDVSSPLNTSPLALSSAVSTYGPLVKFYNCPGINPYTTLTAPTVPTSLTHIQNPFPFPVRVFVQANSGGTATVSLSPASTGGVAVAVVPASGAISVDLEIGEYIALTYSSAPTWIWAGK